MTSVFSEYLIDVANAATFNVNWRYGQTAFNVLHDSDPDIADSIRGTELDPFHDDSRVPAFLERLLEIWNG